MLSLSNNFINLIRLRKSLYVAYDSGGKKKPTIVLLHGIAATSKTWDFLIKDLDCEKYRVVALDLLGFGKSPKPRLRSYSADDHSRYVQRTLRRLSVKKPFIMVGHSMGSIIATNYCYRYKKEVSKLFLLSLPLYSKDKSLKKAYVSSKQTDIYIKIYEYLSGQKEFTIKHSQRIRKLMKLDDGLIIDRKNWNGFRKSLNNTIIRQNTFAQIKDIKVPTEIIYGVLDNLVVKNSVNRLADFDHVKITKLQAAYHLIDKRFARIVAGKINNLIPD